MIASGEQYALCYTLSRSLFGPPRDKVARASSPMRWLTALLLLLSLATLVCRSSKEGQPLITIGRTASSA